ALSRGVRRRAGRGDPARPARPRDEGRRRGRRRGGLSARRSSRARAGAAEPRPERRAARTAGRPDHRLGGAGGRAGAAQRHRRGEGPAALRGRARLQALLARRARKTRVGARPGDRPGDRGAARRPRLRGGGTLHDRAAGSQRPLRVRRYNGWRTDREGYAVKVLRTLSTRSLIVLVAIVAALAAGGAAIAVAADGGSGPTPPAKPLPQALHDALSASEPDGITARIKFTNKLFPSGALLGQGGSALMSGASGRLWLTNDGRGRIELQSDAGDAQIVWNPTDVTVYDASSNTVYHAKLPAHPQDTTGSSGRTAPSVTEISDFLAKLGRHADVSGAQPTDVADQAAYSVSISPKHDGGLLGSAELAWDAAQGIPLRVGIYAQGSSSPVLQIEATKISYGAVSDSDVNVTPSASAKVVDLTAPTPQPGAETKAKPVSGLDAVQAAAGF